MMNHRSKLAIVLACLAICASAAVIDRALESRRHSAAPGDLYEIVWKQIRAFRESDYSTAYRHASTGFQERFNIEAFSDLVRSDYPDLSRAERVEFGSVKFVGRAAIVYVYFFLPSGDVIPCLYSLVHEEDAWKIDGARLLNRWPAGHRMGGMRT